MDTSRSTNWSARALVFSGRPSPAWPLGDDAALALIGIWNALPATHEAMPDAPALGYRGCVLADGKGSEWRAHDGVAAWTSGSNVETRADLGRRFERATLATAPAGALPPDLVP